MSRSDQQYATEAIQLQRDSQPSSSPGNYLRTMHTGAAGNPSEGRSNASIIEKMRYDNATGG